MTTEPLRLFPLDPIPAAPAPIRGLLISAAMPYAQRAALRAHTEETDDDR